MVQKRCFYEWSCRVPLIVAFPDGWKAGTTHESPVSLIELLRMLTSYVDRVNDAPLCRGMVFGTSAVCALLGAMVQKK